MIDVEKLKTLGRRLLKNKYVLLVLALGLALLLWPSGSQKQQAAAPAAEETLSFSIEDEEARLEAILSKLSGAGRVMVRLSLVGGASRDLAESGGQTLVIAGDDGEEAVQLRYLYPEYQGAVVVCSGADTASVRLAITEAVANYTGLKSNRITVMKMSN